MKTVHSIIKNAAALIFLGISLFTSNISPVLASHDPDLDNDGIVEIEDLNIIRASFGKQCGDAGFNAVADTNHDCVINIFDLFFVSKAMGQTFDIVPPSVVITAPENLSLSNQSLITVSGTIDDPQAAVVVNGVPASVSGGTFTAGGVPLQEGTTLITAAATDPANNVGTASIQVTVDTTAPVVVINSPQDGAITTQSTVDITGVVNDITTGAVNANDLTIQVNGVPAIVSNGSFLVVGLPLTPGPNMFTATATDKAGNTDTSSVTITKQVIAGQTISPFFGNNQSASVGTTLSNPLVVVLEDVNGNPIPNRAVTFTVVRGDGTLSNSPTNERTLQVTTNVLGQASVSYTLGTRTGAGNNRVTATAVGFVGEVGFCASALSAPATSVKIISGENQTGVVSQPLPEPFVVVVQDDDGNAVEGISLTFKMLQGGGNFNGAPEVTIPTDIDGRAVAVFTLGAQQGINSNQVNATIPGLTGLPATFIASSVVPGNPADTKVSGVVLDNANNPMPNVTASIKNTALTAVTNTQGQFSISDAPVGAIKLDIDGTTTTVPGLWPKLEFDLITISGQVNTLGMTIHLLPLDTANAKIVGGTQDVILEMANVPGLELKVFANSVTCPNGASQCQAMITQVHRDKVPMPPEGGAAPRLVWTIQPTGIHFDPPAQLTIPNIEGLAPGKVGDIFSFDHDLGQFVSVGPGTVSEDGSVIVSDPGFGIRKGGWGFPPPEPDPVAETDNNNDPFTDPAVQQEFSDAFTESDPGMPTSHEEGGWILQDADGNISFHRWPSGTAKGISPDVSPDANGQVDGKDVIGGFHTHPTDGGPPSQADIDSTGTQGSDCYIISRDGNVYRIDHTTGDVTDIGDVSNLPGQAP